MSGSNLARSSLRRCMMALVDVCPGISTGTALELLRARQDLGLDNLLHGVSGEKFLPAQQRQGWLIITNDQLTLGPRGKRFVAKTTRSRS